MDNRHQGERKDARSVRRYQNNKRCRGLKSESVGKDSTFCNFDQYLTELNVSGNRLMLFSWVQQAAIGFIRIDAPNVRDIKNLLRRFGKSWSLTEPLIHNP
ncbi:hypothetical protein CIG19_07910 [Enterobacterales bacterium CwR94]|nr:hypothetical protein CIG19_07910 [Enterobacterales bacterium CwR94]